VAGAPGSSTVVIKRGSGSDPLPKTGPAVPGVDRSASCAVNSVTTTLVRRLSHVEYNRTVATLFAGVAVPNQVLAEDLRVHGFENNSASLNPSSVLIEQYGDAAVSIAQLAAAKPEAVLPCTPNGADMACASMFIQSFGLRAFRRPLTAEEQSRYEAFFAQQMGAISFNGALELTLQAFLQSPQFNYRLELSSNTAVDGQTVALDDYETASRLSYFLWQTMPDDTLFMAAAKGELHTAAQIEVEARRMLGDDRGTAAIVDFHRQWLDFDRLNAQNKDPMLFPTWNDALRSAEREESDRFVTQVYKEGAGTLTELLTSTKTYVNKPLADLYGVSVSGSDWQAVNLPQDQRSGILTHAAFLASEAHTTNGSPPLRGVAILDSLLCDRPGPPPANANTSTPTNDSGMPRTNRQLFEQRTAPADCQGCHLRINGVGYGLEAYDSTGAYRTTDNGLSVDASGALMGTDVDGAFNGGIELSRKLADSKQVQYCAVRNWYRYAYGRNEATEDWCKLDALYDGLQSKGGDIRELLVQLVTSYEFMHRPAPAP
jgi:hypothetical protein